jgi:hypothetical protein
MSKGKNKFILFSPLTSDLLDRFLTFREKDLSLIGLFLSPQNSMQANRKICEAFKHYTGDAPLMLCCSYSCAWVARLEEYGLQALGLVVYDADENVSNYVNVNRQYLLRSDGFVMHV